MLNLTFRIELGANNRIRTDVLFRGSSLKLDALTSSAILALIHKKMTSQKTHEKTPSRPPKKSIKFQ